MSRYPAGSVPVDPQTITAIAVLGEEGDRSEVSLLRNLVEHERDEIAAAATEAIGEIRGRQRADLRESFARTLPDWPQLDEASAAMVADGYGAEEAACVAYADLVLGHSAVGPDPKGDGDPESLIARGKPRKAIALLAPDDSAGARLLAAHAWEDLGEPRIALREYARLAARGHEPSRAELDAYGVDAERLLLGLLVQPEPDMPAGTEAKILEVLVRHGDYLTVQVLSERSQKGAPSDRVTATDALVRMLDHGARAQPLESHGRREARKALLEAAQADEASVRAIAEEAL